jgi:threonine/homoserine/homoserine lactone efflux protein
MMTALASGVLLGLSAGLAPGPLLALLLTQTLRHGPGEGCKIALTPLITDAPIIILALVLASKLAAIRPLLGMVSIAGGVFVLYLAWESFRPVVQGGGAATGFPRSWSKGILTNLLNPHPWVFWMTVGAAILAKGLEQSAWVAAAFLFGFYLLLVGSKMLLALMAGRSRNLLAGRPYHLVMRGLAVLLALFGLLLFREGFIQLSGWITSERFPG